MKAPLPSDKDSVRSSLNDVETEESRPLEIVPALTCAKANSNEQENAEIKIFHADLDSQCSSTAENNVLRHRLPDESSFSRNYDEIDGSRVLEQQSSMHRSGSEGVFTSYEALEGCLKDTLLEHDFEVDATPDSLGKNETASKKSSSVPSSSSDENEDDQCASIEAVPSDESAVSVDAALGPPRLITTKSPSNNRSLPPSKDKSEMRRGKWTMEEETFVARVIQDFNSGYLDAPAGTTLRTYLSEKLQCDPMRITKKFTGDACIGKRVFHPAVRSPSNESDIETAQAEVANLERRWRRRLDLQHRESAKKAAVAAVAVGQGLQDGSFEQINTRAFSQGNIVTRTASWLDRANAVLGDLARGDKILPPDEASDLQVQIQEVQRLIHEGPIIQRTSAELPDMIDRVEQDARDVAASSSSAASIEVEPMDKRMRTAEDAEALVGFLRSVRASAASKAEGT